MIQEDNIPTPLKEWFADLLLRKLTILSALERHDGVEIKLRLQKDGSIPKPRIEIY